MRWSVTAAVAATMASTRLAAASPPVVQVPHEPYLLAVHVATSVGAVAVARDAADGADGYGGVATLMARGQAGKAPAIALGGDLDLGYADGELVGELRLGVGAGGYAGRVAFTALVGGTAGSLGPAAPAEVFAELSAGFYPQLAGVFLWGGVSHAEGLDDVDRDQVDLRAGVTSPLGTDLGLFFGLRAARIGDGGPPTYVGLFNVGVSMAGGL